MTKLSVTEKSPKHRMAIADAISNATRPILLLSSELDMISVSESARTLLVSESVESLAAVRARLSVTPTMLFNFTKDTVGVQPMITKLPTAFGVCPAAVLVDRDGDTVVIFLPEIDLIEGCGEADLVKRRMLRLLMGFSDAISCVENDSGERMSGGAADKLDALERIIIKAAEQPLGELIGEVEPKNAESFGAVFGGSSRCITAEDILAGAEKEAVRLSDEVRKLLFAADALYQREAEIAKASECIGSPRFLMIIFEAILLSLEHAKAKQTKLWMEENGDLLDIYITGNYSENARCVSFSVTELLLRALGAEICVTSVNGISCIRLRISMVGDYLFYVRKTDEDVYGDEIGISLNSDDREAFTGGVCTAERYISFVRGGNVID